MRQALVKRSELQAADYLANFDGAKPLFLVVCTHPPHTPWIKTTKYGPAEIPLPPNFIDTAETRVDRANYYSDVTLMDSILGDVLDAVAKKGMKDNTLLVYTSDQGANWPFAKWCVYDGGLRVPLIVRWPGKVAPATVSCTRSEHSLCLSGLRDTNDPQYVRVLELICQGQRNLQQHPSCKTHDVLERSCS